MRRPSYFAAIEWLATNDDTSCGTVAGFVADMFGVLDSRVRADVVRALKRKQAYVPNPKADAS